MLNSNTTETVRTALKQEANQINLPLKIKKIKLTQTSD